MPHPAEPTAEPTAAASATTPDATGAADDRTAAGLHHDLVRTGYYPTLVEDVVDLAVAGESLAAHLVHGETTFDGEEIRRHVTVLVLTPTRLVAVHVDDQPADSERPAASAVATSESVPLREIRSVALTHVVTTPESHRAGDGPLELTLAVGWGAVSRVELEPAGCTDPACEADHGLTGQLLPDDLVLRVSAEAEGGPAVRRAVAFARALSAATAR